MFKNRICSRDMHGSRLQQLSRGTIIKPLVAAFCWSHGCNLGSGSDIGFLPLRCIAKSILRRNQPAIHFPFIQSRNGGPSLYPLYKVPASYYQYRSIAQNGPLLSLFSNGPSRNATVLVGGGGQLKTDQK